MVACIYHLSFFSIRVIIQIFVVYLFLLSTGPRHTVHSQETKTYYVATAGRDSNAGTENAPFATIQKAIDSAREGELIYVRGGHYYVEPNTIYKNQGLVIDHKNGSQTSPYRLEAYPGEHVLINGSQVPDAHAVLTLYGSSYWTFKGLVFEKSSSPRTWATHGIVLFGNSSYNLFEDIEIRDMDGVGLLIADESSYNTITHSSSHHNYDGDTQGGNADGFQVVGNSRLSTTPTGNVFTHCAAWNNGDDGFDLWHSYGNEIHTSRAWHNGYHPDGVTPAGDGSGFKLGRGRAGHTVTYSIAWDNRYVGFDYNEGEGAYTIYNNTAYRNRYNFSFPNSAGVEVHNNLSYRAQVRELLENDPSLGTHNSWNLGITEPQFVSTDPASPDFLHLRATSPLRAAGKNVGYSDNNPTPDIGAYPYSSIELGQASDPSPSNELTNVAIDAILSWTSSPEAVSHDIYFGTNPNPGMNEFQDSQAETHFIPSLLSYDTTYYWRIDEVNTDKTSKGIVWNFTTESGASSNQTILISIANEDGWVRESGENTGVGRTINTQSRGSKAIRAGDDKSDRQFMFILSFDTSLLPNDATITSARLELTRGQTNGKNPFDTHGDLYLDVHHGFIGENASLQSDDFEAEVSHPQAAIVTNQGEFGSLYTVDLSKAMSDFHQAERIQIRGYFSLDDDDDRGSDYAGFYSSNYSNSSGRPRFIVTYTR